MFKFTFTLLMLILSLALFDSCKQAPIYRETLIYDTVLVAKPPPIDATMQAVREADTLVRADQIRGKDTIVKVRYYPRTNTITVFAQPDTVRISYRDTTVIFKEPHADSKSDWWAWLLMVAVLAALVFVVWRWTRLKVK